MAPKIGKHFTYASENRKAPSYVQALQLIRRRFKNAKKIHLVQDNLSTHTEASCIKALGMKEGSELWSKFIIHPKHGSWLNLAETEISLWSRECLGKRRIATLPKLVEETRVWNTRAHKRWRKFCWKFHSVLAKAKFTLAGR